MIQSPDAGYPMPGPKEEHAAPNSRPGMRRFLFFLRRFWWIPLLALILSLGLAVGYIKYRMPLNFISSASMAWETEKT